MYSAISRSAFGRKRLPASRIVTLLPNPAYMVANSSPMAPLPMISKCWGRTSAWSNVSLVYTYLLSLNPSRSGRIGIEPVLINISFPSSSKDFSSFPDARVTFTVSSHTKEAVPSYNVILGLPVRLSTFFSRRYMTNLSLRFRAREYNLDCFS